MLEGKMDEDERAWHNRMLWYQREILKELRGIGWALAFTQLIIVGTALALWIAFR
jgi:hypothetical protein